VTVSINSNANGLSAGPYNDTITFENTTNGSGNTLRSVGLTVNPASQTYTVNTNVAGVELSVDGSTYPTPKSFQWIPGSDHTLYAPSLQKVTQKNRYNFSSWSDGGAQTHNISAPASGTTYTANYKSQNTIKVTVLPSGAGTVSLSSSKQPQAQAITVSTEVWYDDDDTVTLTASVGSGYTFSEWTGDLSGKANPAKASADKPKDVVANFVLSAETISTPNAPIGPKSGGTGTSYTYVTGGATSNLGHAVEFQFDWKGDGTDLSAWGGATQAKAWVAAGSYVVKARARCATDTTVVSNWSSGLSVVITQPGGVSYTVATSPPGLQITIDGSVYITPQVFSWIPGSSHTVSVVTPLSGGQGIQYLFSSWSDGGPQSHTVTIPSSNTTYTANFVTRYSLTTYVDPPGGGTTNPSGVNWYDSGQNVPISASPSARFSFSNWTGDVTGLANPTQVTMAGPRTVTANFLALNVTPFAGLSASGLQGGPFFPASQVFTVQNNGGVSVNWGASKSQDWLTLSSSGGPLGPGMRADLTVAFNANANTLAPGTYTDTIMFKDLGNGNTISTRSVVLTVGSVQPGYTVTTDPPGLFVTVDGMNYKAPCTFDWPTGSPHTVSVLSLPQPGVPGTQYVFSRWNEGGSQNHAVTASPGSKLYVAFFDTQYSLTLFVSPAGGGKTGPSGTTWFNAGETVSLSATSNDGYSFTGWSGDVSGTQNPAPLLMDRAKVVTANFSSGAFALTVGAAPSASGSVGKSPDKPTYAMGEQVNLTAVPNQGYVFKNWSGDLTGEANPNTLTIKGNMTATANFVPAPSFDVTPSDGLNILGRQGGTLNPTSQTYTLQNRSGKLLKWKVLKKPKWVTITPASGNLAAGGETQMVVSVGNSAKRLKPGSYSEAFVVGNTANKADGQSRTINLDLKPALKTYAVKSSPEGLQVRIDGVDYVSPQAFEWEVGSSHQLDTPSPQGGSAGVQYAFSSWSNGKPQNQTVVAPASGGTFAATFKVQYHVTTSTGPVGGGTVTPSGSVWFNQGQRVTVKASPNQGFQFLNWSGDLSIMNNPVNFDARKPMDIVANFAEVKGKAATESSRLPEVSKGLPIIGSLESPSEGKKVLGLKTIYGWALDGEGISKVKLYIDDEFVCDIPYGGLTGGLKEAYPDYPDADRGGFALVWNYSNLSPGAHFVRIEVQNTKGEVLNLGANVFVLKVSGEAVNQGNPLELLIPGVKLTVNGTTEIYDLKVEWSKESEAFEIIDF
jgi:hypothetical protein